MSTSFIAKRRFYDDKHFRRGFSRSGAFTIKEADILERSGYAFKELDEAQRDPIDEIEQIFISVCRGEREPSSTEEKVWLKYKKLTGRKSFHGLVSTPKNAPAADDTSTSDDSADDVDSNDLVVDDD
ncbi:DUF413 domain-containing protein [Aliagarivorans taiwanensis]|uniref:DUF413 domain-containing protein n=1 Tax=Aliagarivorans taiwanensis TaxID=561966 RepID=UPI0004019826|nr:DUF413 domain-containing protein [Aliagarivorans taiwanensis]